MNSLLLLGMLVVALVIGFYVQNAFREQVPSISAWGTSFRTQKEVRDAIDLYVKMGAPLESFVAFSKQQRLECSELVEGFVYCSTLGPPHQSRLVGQKWLIKVQVSDQLIVENIIVEEGLTGP